MTLTEALAKADHQFDLIAAQNLLDAEVFIQDLGGSDDEVAAWVQRQRGDLARCRAQMHAMVRAAFTVGFDAPSIRVH